MKLLIAFSDPNLFDVNKLNKLSLNDEIFFLICPFDFLNIFSRLKNRVQNRNLILQEEDTIKYLKKNVKNIKINVLKPNIVDVIYFSIFSLFNASKNIINLIKILKGKRSSISSHNIDITGYCLDSLQRYVSKFRIEKENSILNISVSFLYLFLLELYINWFFSEFKKINIKKVIINHNVYSESGMFAEYSQLLHQSKIIFAHKHFKDILILPNVRKHVFHYIPDMKKKIDLKKNFFWYDKNSIKQHRSLINKNVNLNKVLVVMHAFNDANHIHSEHRPLFQSFYHWIKETLQIAKFLKDQNFIFRIHPSTFKHYPKDEDTIHELFKNLPRNIILEDPRKINNPLHHFREGIPIIITYEGAIILEMGCSGINVVAMSSRTGDDSSIIPSSLSDYKKILAGQLDSKKLYLEIDQILDYKKKK